MYAGTKTHLFGRGRERVALRNKTRGIELYEAIEDFYLSHGESEREVVVEK